MREREGRSKITKQNENNKRGKYQKHTRTNTKQDSWRKQVRCELMDAKGEWMLPQGAIRDEGLWEARRALKCAAAAPWRVLRTVRLIPVSRTHSEVPEHVNNTGWEMCFSLTGEYPHKLQWGRERAEHKGTACGYPRENVSCALEEFQGSLKCMLNMSRHGVWRKISTYLNFSDSALISSEKKERKQCYWIVEHRKKYSSHGD